MKWTPRMEAAFRAEFDADYLRNVAPEDRPPPLEVSIVDDIPEPIDPMEVIQ